MEVKQCMKLMPKDEAFRVRVRAGAECRWGSPLADDVAERLEFEVSVIEGNSKVEYFTLCAEIADVIRDAGALIGPGRGACTASAVCYALGITNLDPIRAGLVFDRFMRPNEERYLPILIDTTSRGVVAFAKYMKEKGGKSVEAKKSGYAPDFYQIDGWNLAVSWSDAVEKLEISYELAEESGIDLPLMEDVDGANFGGAVFKSGDTKDIDGFVSAAIRDELRKMPEISYADVRNLYALNMPGPITYLPQYVECRNHPECVRSRHPLLDSVLMRTSGVLVYQEQMLQIFRQIAGFAREGAYRAYKAITRVRSETCAKMKERFVAGCLANPDFQVGEAKDEQAAVKMAAEIWDDVCRVGRYTYMEAHAAAYAHLACVQAVVKAKCPDIWLYAVSKVEELRRDRERIAKAESAVTGKYRIQNGCSTID